MNNASIFDYLIQGGFATMCLILILMGYKTTQDKQKTTDDFIATTRTFIDHQAEISSLIKNNNIILNQLILSIKELQISLSLDKKYRETINH